jgi:hypothetical protein
MVLLLGWCTQALAVDAATFLAACPGPIFIDTDTTLTGSATISGDCTLSTPAVGPGTPQINLNKASLTFTGFFQIFGNASSVTVDKSKVTTGGGITLDSLGPMAITGSTLTARGGAITLPPRDNLAITGSSTLSAQSDVTLGGPGGFRHVTDSAISAGGAIIIQPGATPSSSINLLRASLSSDSIVLGGSIDAFSVMDTTLEASGGAGISMAPGGAVVVYDIKASKLSAAAGPIAIGGIGSYSIETSKLFSGAPADSAGIVVGERGGASTFKRTQFKTKQSGIQFFGTGSPVFEDCTVQAGGEESGVGILVGRGSPPSIIASKFQARAGGIRIVGLGDAFITGSTLQAKHPSGLLISNSGARSIIRSTLDAPLGPIEISGFGDTDIVGGKLSAQNAGGMLLTCGGSSEVDSVKVLTKGLLRIPNGQGSTVAASNITAKGGFITETGIFGSGDSNVSANTIKASSITVRSFQTTTVIDNTMSATTFEFSSTGPCTSASNKPDIPCF